MPINADARDMQAHIRLTASYSTNIRPAPVTTDKPKTKRRVFAIGQIGNFELLPACAGATPTENAKGRTRSKRVENVMRMLIAGYSTDAVGIEFSLSTFAVVRIRDRMCRRAEHDVTVARRRLMLERTLRLTLVTSVVEGTFVR
jgi:hypothetical protein